MKFSFRLRKSQSDTPTSIYLDINHKNHRRKFGLGLSIHPDLWDSKKQEAVLTGSKFKKHAKGNPILRTELQNLNAKLGKIRQKAQDYQLRAQLEKKAISAIGLQEFLRNELRENRARNQTPFLTKYYEVIYLKGIEDGTIKYHKNGERRQYAPSTIKVKRQSLNALKKYEKETRSRIRFENLDLKWYDKFVSYFMDEGHKQNYIGRLIKEIKVILRRTYEEGIHGNQIFQNSKFATLTEKTKSVYLTDKELEKLEAIPLAGKDRIYRDMFLIGCYTAMRFGDYSTLDTNNIITINKDKYIVKITEKTGEKVIVPLHPFVEKTLNDEAYRNRNKVYPQKLNKRIKQFAKEAGITQEEELIENVKGQKVFKRVPKYRLISSHTARRTGATLLYLNDVPSIDIMKITGHKSEKSFLRYIRVTHEQVAKRMSTNRFFKPLKAV